MNPTVIDIHIEHLLLHEPLTLDAGLVQTLERALLRHVQEQGLSEAILRHRRLSLNQALCEATNRG